jgi:16S rRNA (uracil1498-N3)-methyltransferase
MPGPRFFVASKVLGGAAVSLEPDDARHASTVLRSRPGDPLTLLADGVAWDAEFASVGSDGATAVARRQSGLQDGELPARVTIVQALTKGAKFDEVVEKAVELGAASIVPAICARTESAGSENKVARWRRVARAAAMQSRRRIVPDVASPVSWRAACEAAMPRALSLVAYEQADRATLPAALSRYANGAAVAIAVGPEGGLTPEEVDVTREFGAHIVSLGPTILRTETAAAALLAATAASLGWW